MRLPRFIPSLAVVVVLAFLVVATTAASQHWNRLFNGRNLEGWVPVHENEFEVVDGNLRLVSGMGWLRTDRPYKDFIFEFETRALVENYDSGVFFRAGLEGKPWPNTGFQLNLKQNDLGSLVEQYTLRLPSPAAKVPVGEWMKFRLAVHGRFASAYLNGKRLWSADFIEPAEGYLGIQTENRSFDFRNLRLRELNP